MHPNPHRFHWILRVALAAATALLVVASAGRSRAAAVPVPAQFLEQLCFQAISTSGGWICGDRPEGLSPIVAETVADAYTWNASIKGDSYTGSGMATTQGGALPGTSVTLALDATPAAPSEGTYVTTAYGIARGIAEATYQVIVINDLGSPVTSVPLVITASGESRPGPLSGRTGPYGWAQSWARLTVEYPGADGNDAVLEEEAFACIFQNGAACHSNPSFDVFAVGEALPVRVGASAGASATVDVRVRAEAEIQGEIYVLKGIDTFVVEAASGTVASSVDPAIYIDPSWPHASLYHLEFSEGIEAPEPGAAALGGAALAGLFAIARGRSRGGSPQRRSRGSASSP